MNVVYYVKLFLQVKFLKLNFLDTPELCIVNSPFDTSYFKPWLETPRKAIGCWAASNGQEVHIIFLQSSHILPTVRLNIITMQANTYYNEDVSKLVLILMSDKKVDWKLQKVYKRDIEQESKFLHKPFPHVIVSIASKLSLHIIFRQYLTFVILVFILFKINKL